MGKTWLRIAGTNMRIGLYSEMFGWYVLGVDGCDLGASARGTAAYYDFHAKTWCVFAIDQNGQQDGDTVYTSNTWGIIAAGHEAHDKRWDW